MPNLKITTHAAVRFLERVFEIKNPTREQIENAKILIKKDLANIMFSNMRGYLPMPSFPNIVIANKDYHVTTVLYKKQ